MENNHTFFLGNFKVTWKINAISFGFGEGNQLKLNNVQ